MKTSIIAELGINYNQDKQICFKLIEEAKRAGADTAKFQFFRARFLYSPCSAQIKWKDSAKDYSYDVYNNAELTEIPYGWLGDIIKHCRKLKIEFLASVFDKNSLGLLIKNGLSRIKLASSVITDIPLIEHCARTKLPILISTGASDIGEVAEAVYAITKYHTDITLLQCTMGYPAKLSECNLGVLDTFRYAFPFVKLGFSDHTTSVSSAVRQAVYLGASVIEKHFTLDKKMKGPDHFFALEPQELKEMIIGIREAEKQKGRKRTIDKVIYGSTEKKVLDSERYLKNFTYPVIFAKRNIRENSIISPRDLVILRKAEFKGGIPAKYAGLFKNNKIATKRNLRKYYPIDWKKDIF